MIEKERTDPFEEFRDGLQKLAAGTAAIASGGIGDGISIISQAYPYIRSVNENMQKYVFARRFVTGSVLDVPCGTGYGSAILASAGVKVFGMDRDADVISGCEYVYRYPNVRFIVGDMMDESDYPSSFKFDCIVCLDGLEHITPGEELVRILHSKLKDGGTLVISAPNSGVLDLSTENNMYHLEDYDKEKFVGLVSPVFREARFYSIGGLGDVSPVDLAFTQYLAACRK